MKFNKDLYTEIYWATKKVNRELGSKHFKVYRNCLDPFIPEGALMIWRFNPENRRPILVSALNDIKDSTNFIDNFFRNVKNIHNKSVREHLLDFDKDLYLSKKKFKRDEFDLYRNIGKEIRPLVAKFSWELPSRNTPKKFYENKGIMEEDFDDSV